MNGNGYGAVVAGQRRARLVLRVHLQEVRDQILEHAGRQVDAFAQQLLG